MEKAILDIPKQFTFVPKVENQKALKARKKFLVCGMGGSQLAADIWKCANPDRDLVGWRDYGLPELADIKDRLIILSSYSGNTEEAISSFKAARKKGLAVAVVAKGGELLRLAEKNGVAYVRIPDTGIQPRMATGFMLRATMAILGDAKGLRESGKLAKVLFAERSREKGRELAAKLSGHIPVVYSSLRNEAVARNWKIKFNENGKIPAFYNVMPELNHNEMTGFDVVPGTRPLAHRFSFIFLKDSSDAAPVRKRMEVLGDLFAARGLEVFRVELEGRGYEKIFRSAILGDWTSYYSALQYGTDPEQVPMVEQFKKLIG